MPFAKPKQTKKKAENNSDIHLYQLRQVIAPGGLEVALEHLYRRSLTPNLFAQDFQGLVAEPSVLCVLLSAGLSVHTALRLVLFESFPNDVQTYNNSLQAEILNSVRGYLSTLSLSSTLGSGYKLYSNYRDTVPLVARALASLPSLKFEKEEEDSLSHFITHNKSSRRTSKRDKGRPSSIPIDKAAFTELQVAMPRSSGEAMILGEDFIKSQCDSLKYFLELLENPDVATIIKVTVLRVVEAPNLPSTMSSQATASSAATTTSSPVTTSPVVLVSEEDAYPMVAPDRAKQSFSSPEGFGEWNLFISTTAIKHLRNIRREDSKKFQIVEKKVKELSRGFFSASNHKRLEGSDEGIPIYEAKMTSDLRLVYHVDLQTDLDSKRDRQVLRIHGVYTHAQFDHRLWNRVSQSLPRRDKEYRRRCLFRLKPIVRGSNVNNVTSPMEWDHHEPKEPGGVKMTHAFTEEEALELHKMLSLEKFVLFSNGLLNSIIWDVDAVHEFAVSPTENRIINHPSSCFVIGRSGTGKTTTMLFKILGIEKAKSSLLSADDEGNPKYRQVFLTQSHVLAKRVQDYYEQLSQATELGGRPGHVAPNVERDLLELDEEADERLDLPKRFSELRDEHFPLFITYDQLRRMLESDFGLSYNFSRSALKRRAAEGAIKLGDFDDGTLDTLHDDAIVEQLTPSTSKEESPDKMVTFDTFATKYWPHLDQRLRKSLDPGLVFSEIMGVIAGHESSLKTDLGYLTRDAYCSLSSRAHAAFSDERDRIYSIFESYVKLKVLDGAYDGPDRTHAILRFLQSSDMKHLGKFDFLYVDEVQDLLIIDTKLLRALCPNPHGLFWGGDTAQTISVGSSFRFEDLKALMWREEEANPLVAEKKRSPIHAELFELLVNYRSHGGIVDCAASLIECISNLFPYSIDKLQRESAVVSGPKPRVFRDAQVHFEQFLCGTSDRKMDFGARQAILVRNDDEREKLLAEIGEAASFGLILTLLESKGLEFDDVLLYNFFGTSPATQARWRIVNGGTCDLKRHGIIETELKRLYVAVTRARHHVWIWDTSELALPMMEFWSKRGLIRVQDPTDPIPQLATSSTPEEWNVTGKYLFAKGLFMQAASCFEKADRPLDSMVAEAYHMRKEARRVDAGVPRTTAYRKAAYSFKECAITAKDDYSRGLFRRAAECFREANDLESAAENYESAAEFTEAAKHYRRAGAFDRAVGLVKPRDGSATKVEISVADDIIDLAKLQYLRVNNISGAAALFNSVEEQLEYMDDYGFSAARKHVLKEIGDYYGAAELHLKDGEVYDAAECYLESSDLRGQKLALRCILKGLWARTFSADLTPEANALHQLLRRIPLETFSDDIRAEIEMFKAVASRNHTRLYELAKTFGEKRMSHAILCVNHALRFPLHFTTSSPSEIASKLPLIELYVRGITVLLREVDICKSSEAAQLLGFFPARDSFSSESLPDQYLINRHSYLAVTMLAAQSAREPRTDIGDLIVGGQELEKCIRNFLENTVRSLLNRIHTTMMGVPAIRPCLEFATLKTCNRVGCRRDHSPPNIEIIRQRTQVHMQFILALECLWRIPFPENVRDNQLNIRRIWIERLYSTLHPVIHHFGNASLALVSGIPESSKAIPVVKKWTQELIYNLQWGRPQSKFLTDVLTLTTLDMRLHAEPPIYWRYVHSLSSLYPDLLVFYSSTSPDYLRWGLLFARHIIERDLLIDINVLIHFLEELALEIIAISRYHSEPFLHDTLLPRSWILKIVRPKTRGMVTGVTWDRVTYSLLNPASALLHKLYTWDGTGSLMLDGYPMPKAYVVRNVFIARICRLLVLVGQNVCTKMGQDTVGVGISTAFGAENSHPSPLYSGFVRARNWREMCTALGRSMPGDDVDSLVHLVYTGHQGEKSVPNAKSFVFSNLLEIERGHAYNIESMLKAKSSLEPDSSGEHPVEVADEETPRSEEVTGYVSSEALPSGPVDVRQSDEPVQVPNQIIAESRSPEEHEACRAIQRWYRHVSRRIKHRQSATSHLSRYFDECCSDITNVGENGPGPASLFLLMVRGPLPHILSALENLLASTRRVKSGAKGRLTKDSHQDLEKIRTILNQTTQVYKSTLAARKKLSPKHDIFRSCVISSLKEGVQEAVQVFEQGKVFLKPDDIWKIEEDMNIGVKGIVTRHVKKPTPKASKDRPSLNVEDL